MMDDDDAFEVDKHRRSGPTQPEGWNTFYSNFTKVALVPATQELVKGSNELSIRDLVLELTSLPCLGETSAFSDVLNLSADTTIDLTSGGSVFLVCRTLCCKGSRILRVHVGSRTAKLVIYATELQGDLEIIFTQSKGPASESYSFAIGESYIGTMYTFRASTSRLTGEKAGLSSAKLNYLDENIHNQPLQERLLQTQLRVASLLMFRYPDISHSILLFICRLTHKSHVAALTHLEASTMLVQVDTVLDYGRDGHVISVPSVTMDIYEGTVAVLLDAAKAFAKQYDRFVDKYADSESRREAALLMVQQNTDATKAQRQLLVQARLSWEDAKSATRAAQNNSKIIKAEIHSLGEEFSVAARDWARAKRRAALFKLVSVLISFGTAAAGLVGGNFSGLTDSDVSSLFTGDGSFDNLVKVATSLEELALTSVEFHEETRKTADQLQRLSNIDEGLNRNLDETYQVIKTMTAAKKGVALDVGNHAASLHSPDPNGTNASAGWDVWRANIEATMQPAIQNQIPKSYEYLAALQKQAIYGKAHHITKAAEIKAGQEYARALLQYKTTGAQEGRLEAYADDIQDKSTTFNEKAAAFYDQLLKIRTFVVIQLRNYTAAYNYFSLERSIVPIDMQRSIVMLLTDFATVKQELAMSLANYSSDPQPFRLVIHSTELPHHQQSIVDDMKSSGRFLITFDESSVGLFEDMFRIRLRGVRIWLDGAVPKTSSVTVKLRIETNGLYGDISRDGFFLVFAMQTLKRSFRYQLEGDKAGEIVMDSVIPDGFHNPPTPFAQWTVVLQNSADVDLSNLRSVRFEWIGTAYAR